MFFYRCIGEGRGGEEERGGEGGGEGRGGEEERGGEGEERGGEEERGVN